MDGQELRSRGSGFPFSDTPNGLANPLFIGRIAQAKIAKSLHQLIVGWIQFESMKERLSAVR